MDAETIQEFKKIAEHAQDGNWIPVAIVGVLLGAIFGLLFLHWNTVQKNNTKRHDDSEATLLEAVKNTTELRILSQKYDTTLISHQGQISENRRTIKEVQKKTG